MPNVSDASKSPFYFPAVKNSSMEITVKKLNEDEDACFSIYYYVTSRSKLWIKIDNKRLPIKLTSTLKFNENDNEFKTEWSKNEQTFCIRDLIGDSYLNKEFKLAFEAEMIEYEEDNDLVAIHFVGKDNKIIDYRHFDRKTNLYEFSFIPRWNEVNPDVEVDKIATLDNRN